MSFLGKVMILAALCGYTYLLYSDATMISTFDKKYKAFQEFPLIKQNIPSTVWNSIPNLLARQVICGLIGSSVLMLLSGCFALFPVIGLLLHIAIMNNPVLYTQKSDQIEFLKFIAVLGGVLVWANASCTKCAKQQKVKQL